MAEGDGTIDPLDENTWQGEDLKRLEEGIWNCIAPCSTHQGGTNIGSMYHVVLLSLLNSE